MIARLKKIYISLPAWMKRVVAVVPFEYRLGSSFRATLALLRESDKWSQKRVRGYQETELGRLLDHAIRNVPYYERYKRFLTKPAFEILREIEPVTKSEIQQNLDLFVVPEHLRGAHHITYTGGSSGKPLKIYQNDDALEKEWAFMIAQWIRAEYRLGDKRAAFRGVEFRGSQTDIVRENPIYDEILLSPFDLTEKALERYIKELRNFRPRFLRGYPSAISVLASYIRDNKVTHLPDIKGVLCGSEGLFDGQRELIESAFDAPVYSWYGMSEKVVLAGECERSNLYHAFPQYGITEIVDSNGNVTSEPGSEGEIVGTGFLNRVMPFIRYRLDDSARIVGNRCSECRRNHLLLSDVKGHRVQDAIIGKSGGRISMTAINMHDKTFEGVRQFQFRQTRKGEVTLFLKVSREFSDEKRTLILKSLKSKTRDEIDYDIRLVDSIDVSGMGKGIYLRQEIDSDE